MMRQFHKMHTGENGREKVLKFVIFNLIAECGSLGKSFKILIIKQEMNV